MPTWHKDNGDVREMVELVMSRYHQPLVDAGVTLDIMIALPKETDGTDLVRLHGRECYATIGINSYKLRAQGLADATLRVDGIKWRDLTERERAALIDHELLHLELRTKVEDHETGQEVVARDDMDRPKLKIRPHDWEIGGFDLIVSRHGEHAIELEQCRAALKSQAARQALLPFMREMDAPPLPARREPGEVMTNAPGVRKRRAKVPA